MIMNDPADDPLLPKLRVMQIIALAMVSGALVFLAIVLLVPRDVRPPDADPVLTWISLGGAPIQVLLALLVPAPVARAQRRSLRAGNQPGHEALPLGPERAVAVGVITFQVKLLIRLALLEGGVFFSLMAYMVEGQWPTLIVAVVLLALMAANFPTRDRLERWLNERVDRE